MELPIDQALQRGIAAHREGNLQEAERLYRVVLQSQPAHPDANHNLGVLAVSVNKTDVALPLFKTALEANPKIEQFWLSYVDALIKEKQFETAKKVIDHGKEQGVAGEKLNVLEAQFTSATQVNEPKLAVSPSQAELSSLLEHYQAGRYGDAEKLAITMTREFPEHQLGWEILGALLKQTGNTLESLFPSQKALEINPQNSGGHYNVGNTFTELGRLDEAEASYLRAITLKPEFAEAHNNLGNTLKALGRFEEAEASYAQTIILKPDFSIAHNNLGNIHQELGRQEEAEANYAQAIVLNPDYAEAHCNLGNTLKELGRLDEAAATYKQAIAVKPDFTLAYSNLGNTLQELGRLEEAKVSYTQAIALKPDFAEAHYNLGITLKILGNLEEAAASYEQAIALQPKLAEAHGNLSAVFLEMGRLNEAEAGYRKAIALKPSFAIAHHNLGATLQNLGRLEKAEASYKQAIVLQPDYSEAHNSLLKCLYLQDKQSHFFHQLDSLISQGEVNSVIGSFACRSTLKYQVERSNPFCQEPLKYVLYSDLTTDYDFEDTFMDKVRTILQEERISDRTQSLLVNGHQTSGNLFQIEDDFTKEIQQVIQIEIEKYRVNFKNSDEGLIRKWPADYFLYGWLISMKSGGKLAPHIHDRGWLSGSVYISVPSKSQTNSGNLVVSLGEEGDAVETSRNRKKIIEVVTGGLVLFPASLTHYTIPFESKEDRIVLAFDVIPK